MGESKISTKQSNVSLFCKVLDKKMGVALQEIKCALCLKRHFVQMGIKRILHILLWAYNSFAQLPTLVSKKLDFLGGFTDIAVHSLARNL